MPLRKPAVYLAYQTDCRPCALREQCLASGAKGDRARRVSAVRRLLPPPTPVPVERKPILLGPIRWVDVAGRALRRNWMTHWRRQYVEILPLTDMLPGLSPLLAHHGRCGRIIVGVGKIGSPAMPGRDHPTSASPLLGFPFPRQQLTQEALAHQETVSMTGHLLSELVMRAKIPVAFSNLLLLLYRSLAYTSLRIPWVLRR